MDRFPDFNIEKDKWTGIRMGVSESRRKLCMQFKICVKLTQMYIF